MESFWKYLEYRVAEAEEIPPGVDPELWQYASEQMKNTLRAAAQKAQAQQPVSKPVASSAAPKQAARALAPIPAYQGASDVANAIRTYLNRLPGMPNEGSLDELKKHDLDLAMEIQKGIDNKSIVVHRNRSDTFGFRGVNFFINKKGRVGFIVNR